MAKAKKKKAKDKLDKLSPKQVALRNAAIQLGQLRAELETLMQQGDDAIADVMSLIESLEERL